MTEEQEQEHKIVRGQVNEVNKKSKEWVSGISIEEQKAYKQAGERESSKK